jgi:hypothetical protein
VGWATGISKVRTVFVKRTYMEGGPNGVQTSLRGGGGVQGPRAYGLLSNTLNSPFRHVETLEDVPMERVGASGQVAAAAGSAAGSKMQQHCVRGALGHKDQQTIFLHARD